MTFLLEYKYLSLFRWSLQLVFFSYTYNVSSFYINCYFFVALNLCSSVRTHFLCLLFLKIGTPTVFLAWLDLFYAALRKTNFGFKVTSLICLIIWINQLLLDTIFFFKLQNFYFTNVVYTMNILFTLCIWCKYMKTCML